jgi:hypothetical protein
MTSKAKIKNNKKTTNKHTKIKTNKQLENNCKNKQKITIHENF